MKALIAMSGGVDSSVAALSVKNMGYECVGCTMKLYETPLTDFQKSCCSLSDTEDARSVARKLSMPYYVFNFKDEFETKVIDKFIKAYEQGRTPNPCIDCNRFMKFDKLFLRAQIMGCEKIATGHYARVRFENGKYQLSKALDETKDQSYVLYSFTQEQLSHVLFPLGELRKTQVREIARQNGFQTADKPDSQDICFVPGGDYADFISRHSKNPAEEGDFIGENGEILGRHKGIIHYTVGQRKGLGLSFGKPMFVSKISKSENAVYLSGKEGLYSSECLVENFNWISGEAPKDPVKCAVKIRYRKPEEPATLYPLENGNVKIIFDAPQRAVTPGQAAVAYSGDVVIGGGEII